MFATLTIGNTAPVAQSDEKGLKTLYVRALQNWPAAAGEAVPSIPLDIQIKGKVTRGSVHTEFCVPLPAPGLAMPFNCDQLIVDAYYWPAQGLAIPYASYQIDGSVVMGAPCPMRSGYAARCDYFDGPVTGPWIPWAPFNRIPDFSTEIRVDTNCDGGVGIFSNKITTDFEYYLHVRRLRHWYPLHPLASWWQIALFSGSINSFSNFVNVEFR